LGVWASITLNGRSGGSLLLNSVFVLLGLFEFLDCRFPFALEWVDGVDLVNYIGPPEGEGYNELVLGLIITLRSIIINATSTARNLKL
jgi:hypothetical protein